MKHLILALTCLFMPLHADWVSLFDGKTLEGWTNMGNANWRVENGAITVDEGKSCLLVHEDTYKDYELKLEFKAAKGCNSGVFLNTVQKPKNVGKDCYELNIADPTNPFPTGSLVKQIRYEGAGETNTWRRFEVRVLEGKVTVELDGQQIIDFQAEPLSTGNLLGLQKNSGRVAFRNIKARRISQPSKKMVHPGISHSQKSLDFIKAKITAGKEPWVSAWEGVQSSRYANLDWRSQPHAHVERGPYNNPNIGSSEFTRDAQAAYVQAIHWALTGKDVHAKKSAEILDAWSGTLKSVSNHDARLLIGMEGYKYCNAAELLKHTWDGWPEEHQKQFEKMLREIFYPAIKNFYPTANGNWDASMLQTIVAMGIFLDDRKMFDHGVNYYLKGDGNGAVRNYFKPSGQCQESGRDQGHTQMGLNFLAATCEVAWNQGVDLYGAFDNRLLKGHEYTTKYNLGNEVAFEFYESYQGRYKHKKVSDKDRGRLQPIYEKVLNHYQNRKGMKVVFTKQAVMKLREGTKEKRSRKRSRSSALDTLMFAGEVMTK